MHHVASKSVQESFKSELDGLLDEIGKNNNVSASCADFGGLSRFLAGTFSSLVYLSCPSPLQAKLQADNKFKQEIASHAETKLALAEGASRSLTSLPLSFCSPVCPHVILRVFLLKFLRFWHSARSVRSPCQGAARGPAAAHRGSNAV